MTKYYTVTCYWCKETQTVTMSEYWNYDGKMFLHKDCRATYRDSIVGKSAEPVILVADAGEYASIENDCACSDEVTQITFGDAEPDAEAMRNLERAAKGV